MATRPKLATQGCEFSVKFLRLVFREVMMSTDLCYANP